MPLPQCRRRLRPRLMQRASLFAAGPRPRPQTPRPLVTLAIETSCDDTAVAVLSRARDGRTSLLFNERLSSDNRAFRGINPVVTVEGHNRSLAPLARRALASLPDHDDAVSGPPGPPLPLRGGEQTPTRKKQVPDFVCATRGPGIMSNLAVGLNLAKGLALAWGVPLVGVHHMQAHALTPRLVRALEQRADEAAVDAAEDAAEDAKRGSAPAIAPGPGPHFPFLSLLVSGGHTQLVHSASLTEHRIIATTGDIAIGNLLDQAARVILPPDVLDSGPDVMYGRMLESFAFPDPTAAAHEAFFQPAASRHAETLDVPSGYPWSIPLPFRNSRALAYSFASIHMHVHRIAAASPMALDERRALARHTLRAAFQHLVGRLVLALEDRRGPKTLVVAGGVASNRFLMHVLRSTLAARGFADVEVVVPPVELCTDNAAMIAWAGMEMYEAGHVSDLSVLPIAKWPMDSGAGNGILGADGWLRRVHDE